MARCPATQILYGIYMIKTENFVIEKIENLTSLYIENCLAQKGIEPLRWAIVDTTDKNLIVSVSYKKFV